MAYVPTPQIPEDQQNIYARKDQTTPNPIPPQTGGSAGGGTGGGAAPGVGTSTQFGSNAAKLSDYLKANAEQVQGFGNQIAGNLTQNYNQTMGDINSAFGNFGQQVTQGTPQLDQSKIDAAAKNPSGFVSNPDDVKSFQSTYQGTYTGPNSVEEYSPYSSINNEVNKAVENSSLVKTPAGIGTYLNNMGYNDTTEGMRTLDSALLSGNPNATKAIQTAAAPYSGLTNYLTGKVNEGNKTVGNAKQQTQTASDALKNRFTGQGGVIPTFENDLTSRLNTARTDAKTKADKVMSDFLNGGSATPQVNLTPDDLKLLGVKSPWNNDAVNQTLNLLKSDFDQTVPLANFLTEKTPEAVFNTADTVANPQDYATAAALSQLTGQDFSGMLDQSKAGNAGQFNGNLLDFNLQGFNDATGNALRNDYINALMNDLKGTAFEGQGMDAFNNPDTIKAFQNTLKGKDLDVFNHALQNLNLTGGQPPINTGGVAYNPTTGTFQYTSPVMTDPNTGLVTGGNATNMPASTIHNPDGSWSIFNPQTGQYEPYTGPGTPTMSTTGFVNPNTGNRIV